MSKESSTDWQPWQPTDTEPWNVARVVHLHRRAGFAATWNELQRDLKDGPQAAIDRLLAGESRIEGVPSDFDQISDVIGTAAVGSGSSNRLKAWWMYRMLLSPDPLAEKLTLLWHNHFATSNLKVDDLGAMRRQNQTLRNLAKAPFGEILNAMLRDPALLNWLDAPANKKGSPNENLARELMELFTLGIGNYTEGDVKQAARALTGWTVRNGTFHENAATHDAGEKTILGKTGKWRTPDLAETLLDHPATSQRLAWRICELLMGEGVANASAIERLAAGLRENDLSIGWAVEKVLCSELFFADANLNTRVAAPIEFILNSVRAFEIFDPPPSTLLLAEWSSRMGQDLFYPPNVGGWSGGRDWLSSRYIIARANFAAALVEGKLSASPSAPNLWKLAAARVGASDLKSCVSFMRQVTSGKANADQCRELIEFSNRESSEEKRLRLVVALMLAGPESQLL
jgi:uncharacterized protein (DUF1800 family)